MLLILAALHVDEVADDEAAHVAQAHLAGDLVRRFHVRLQDGFIHVLAALVAARVHVDGDEGFGLVEDDVTAALEPDLAVEGIVDLALDTKLLEDRERARRGARRGSCCAR